MAIYCLSPSRITLLFSVILLSLFAGSFFRPVEAIYDYDSQTFISITRPSSWASECTLRVVVGHILPGFRVNIGSVKYIGASKSLKAIYPVLFEFPTTDELKPLPVPTSFLKEEGYYKHFEFYVDLKQDDNKCPTNTTEYKNDRITLSLCIEPIYYGILPQSDENRKCYNSKQATIYTYENISSLYYTSNNDDPKNIPSIQHNIITPLLKESIGSRMIPLIDPDSNESIYHAATIYEPIYLNLHDASLKSAQSSSSSSDDLAQHIMQSGNHGDSYNILQSVPIQTSIKQVNIAVELSDSTNSSKLYPVNDIALLGPFILPEFTKGKYGTMKLITTITSFYDDKSQILTTITYPITKLIHPCYALTFFSLDSNIHSSLCHNLQKPNGGIFQLSTVIDNTKSKCHDNYYQPNQFCTLPYSFQLNSDNPNQYKCNFYPINLSYTNANGLANIPANGTQLNSCSPILRHSLTYTSRPQCYVSDTHQYYKDTDPATRLEIKMTAIDESDVDHVTISYLPRYSITNVGSLLYNTTSPYNAHMSHGDKEYINKLILGGNILSVLPYKTKIICSKLNLLGLKYTDQEGGSAGTPLNSFQYWQFKERAGSATFSAIPGYFNNVYGYDLYSFDTKRALQPQTYKQMIEMQREYLSHILSYAIQYIPSRLVDRYGNDNIKFMDQSGKVISNSNDPAFLSSVQVGARIDIGRYTSLCEYYNTFCYTNTSPTPGLIENPLTLQCNDDKTLNSIQNYDEYNGVLSPYQQDTCLCQTKDTMKIINNENSIKIRTPDITGETQDIIIPPYTSIYNNTQGIYNNNIYNNNNINENLSLCYDHMSQTHKILRPLLGYKFTSSISNGGTNDSSVYLIEPQYNIKSKIINLSSEMRQFGWSSFLIPKMLYFPQGSILKCTITFHPVENSSYNLPDRSNDVWKGYEFFLEKYSNQGQFKSIIDPQTFKHQLARVSKVQPNKLSGEFDLHITLTMEYPPSPVPIQQDTALFKLRHPDSSYKVGFSAYSFKYTPAQYPCETSQDCNIMSSIQTNINSSNGSNNNAAFCNKVTQQCQCKTDGFHIVPVDVYPTSQIIPSTSYCTAPCPCMNNGKCIYTYNNNTNNILDYTCDCKSTGFTGPLCQNSTPTDSTLPNTPICQLSSFKDQCIMGSLECPNSNTSIPQCLCQPGWETEPFQTQKQCGHCIIQDICSTYGTHKVSYTRERCSSGRCVCSKGYMGSQCKDQAIYSEITFIPDPTSITNSINIDDYRNILLQYIQKSLFSASPAFQNLTLDQLQQYIDIYSTKTLYDNDNNTPYIVTSDIDNMNKKYLRDQNGRYMQYNNDIINNILQNSIPKQFKVTFRLNTTKLMEFASSPMTISSLVSSSIQQHTPLYDLNDLISQWDDIISDISSTDASQLGTTTSTTWYDPVVCSGYTSNSPNIPDECKNSPEFMDTLYDNEVDYSNSLNFLVDNGHGKDKSMNVALVAGVVGGACGLFIISMITIICMKKKQKGCFKKRVKKSKMSKTSAQTSAQTLSSPTSSGHSGASEMSHVVTHDTATDRTTMNQFGVVSTTTGHSSTMPTPVPGNDGENLPSGWIKMYDPSSKRKYYMNENTLETSWEAPNPDGTKAISASDMGW